MRKVSPYVRSAGVLVLGTALLTAACSRGPVRNPSTVGCDPATVQARMEALGRASDPTIGGGPIAALPVLVPLYKRRGWEPIWNDSSKCRALLTLVEHSKEHGLAPLDFHERRVRAWLDPGTRNGDAAFLADREILFSDALARLAVTLHFGKLDPAKLDPAWNFARRPASDDPANVLAAIVASRDLVAMVEGLAPQIGFYTGLREALQRYRAVWSSGGWPRMGPGTALKPGDRDSRVTALRQRLLASGELRGPDPADPQLFGEGVTEAVKRFQTRHGIEADGKVGPRTLEELDVPVEARIDQIRANLERVRWVFREIPRKFVLVDIAGYRLHLYQDGRETWSTRVQVGKPHHSTPVFRSMLKLVVFNPTWTIPPGILRRETLPKLLKDPIAYLGQHDMSLVTHSGKVVDPTTVDWDTVRRGRFPYMVRQEPGPKNALGRVKFLFPNPYLVYVHDTPSQARFGSAERAFSHGCIRTENPLDLAELLLRQQGWDRARIDRVLAGGRITEVAVDPPVPVVLLYWTAEAGPDGSIQFRRDLYGRDRRIIEGLNTPYLVEPPKAAVPEDRRTS